MKEIYHVLAGALGQEHRLAQIANNLANVNTVGFRQDRTAFEDMFQASLAPGAADDATRKAWPTLGQNFVDCAQGQFQVTGRPLDVAIESDGFFQVQVAGEAGPLYTRAGNFRLNDNSELVTADGSPVLDSSGKPISLTQPGKPEITADGEIMIGGATVGKLGVARFANPAKMEKFGNGLLRAPNGESPEAVARPQLRQGSIEGSNVNSIGEMINMIQVERAYQSQQKVIQTIDELMARRIQNATG